MHYSFIVDSYQSRVNYIDGPPICWNTTIQPTFRQRICFLSTNWCIIHLKVAHDQSCLINFELLGCTMSIIALKNEEKSLLSES